MSDHDKAADRLARKLGTEHKHDGARAKDYPKETKEVLQAFK